MLIARLAMALSFTLVIRPAHHARRQPPDSRIHPGELGVPAAAARWQARSWSSKKTCVALG